MECSSSTSKPPKAPVSKMFTDAQSSTHYAPGYQDPDFSGVSSPAGNDPPRMLTPRRTTLERPMQASSAAGTTSRTPTNRPAPRRRTTFSPTVEVGPVTASPFLAPWTSNVSSTWKTMEEMADSPLVRQPQRRGMLWAERVRDGLLDQRLLEHLPLEDWRVSPRFLRSRALHRRVGTQLPCDLHHDRLVGDLHGQ